MSILTIQKDTVPSTKEVVAIIAAVLQFENNNTQIKKISTINNKWQYNAKKMMFERDKYWNNWGLYR